jgi:glycosyltransferase involved in cell wall biosynthesis
VIEALGVLKQRGREIVVVATGNPLDHRHPEHLVALNKRIDELDLRTNFRMLGMVPRAHVISLMRTCAGLINPSLFEGWSSTVEEGRTLGVPMLLSAIGVHREQMGENAIYFDPNEPRDLAEKLQAMNMKMQTLVAPRSVEGSSDGNVRRFAGDFVSVVTRARD